MSPLHKIRLAPDLELPLDIVTARSSVFGVSGSGKSTFGRLLAEGIHAAGQRFCVIDLKNDWWGLKSSADGKHPAIPVVVIGGPRGDIPLDADAGAAVADIVAEVQQSSFIVDLDALSKGKGIRFLGAFLERLYDVNREPLLLICDEADRYGPQKPMSVEANVTLGAADDIARRGRKRGIGSLWLSQRPAVINKNITSQCELVVTFRTPSELDQKELRSHIGRVASEEQVAETMRTVGALANGEAIFMSQHPDFSMFRTVQLPLPRTFDSSATPKVGQRRIEPRQLAAPDLAALGERIKATVEKAKAEDPKALQRQLTAAHAEIARLKKAAPAVDPKAIERAHAEAAAAAAKWHEMAFAKWRATTERAAAELRRLGSRLHEVADELRRPIDTPKPAPTSLAPASPAPRPQIPRSVAPGSPRAAGAGSPTGSLPKGERQILTAIAQHPEGVSREQLSVLTAYKRSSRDTYLQKLNAAGLIALQGGLIVATPEGVAALGDFEPLPTGDALREHWLARLPEGERRVLEVCVGAYPDAIAREVVDEHTGYKRSSRDTYLQRLMARRLVDAVGRGEVRASAQLFSYTRRAS